MSNEEDEPFRTKFVTEYVLRVDMLVLKPSKVLIYSYQERTTITKQ